MFNLSDLKQTRFYQDVFTEGKTEGKAEGKIEGKIEAQAEAKQREKTAILRMFNRGLNTDEIATFLDLPVAEVAATIAQSEQN